MSAFLIATLVIAGCDVLIAGAIPAVKFLFKPAKKVAAETAATPAETSAEQVQEPEAEAADGCSGFNVGFNAYKMTFKEAYKALSKEQKKYFDGIRNYALGKDGAKLSESLVSQTVFIHNKPILKLKIRRGVTIASFKVENDLIRDFKHQVETTSGIKEKETEIRITDKSIFATACSMVDLMVKQCGQEHQKVYDKLA